ncbi:FG-GAP repeat domain-containing protein [Streptomyces sp. NPDC001744]|uniref:FG-GAP repeat domain-containing protein n=1 Tax=Streptomyces sp. NPDC001744 TaxID=3364606 RepID=UPI0036C1AC7B
MNHHVRPRRATLRRVLGAALIPVVGVGVAATAAPSAFAVPAVRAAALTTPDPWAESTALSDGTADEGVLDLVTAKDGAVVALAYRVGADRKTHELRALVRPAGSTAWGTPQLLATTPTYPQDTRLTVSADGAVVATWSGGTAWVVGDTFRMAVLEAGATTWSAVTDVPAPGSHGIKVAGSPSGRLVAVWVKSAGRTSAVYTSVRPAPGQAWSDPVRLSEDLPGIELVYQAELVVSEQGAATVAFDQYGALKGEVKVAELPADGTAWTTPVTVSQPDLHARVPSLALGKDGRAVLVWANQAAPDSSETTQVFAQRPAGSTVWSAEEPAGGFEAGTWRQVVVGPEGDVTLLSVTYGESDGFAARTVTRSAATGAWSPVKALSTGYVPDDQFDLAVGPDGGVHAIWTQNIGDNRKVMASSRVNGAWSDAPTPLSTNTEGYALGQVTADAAGRPVAVWQQTAGELDQMRAATTAPAPVVPPKPLPAWRDVSGDGRGDLLALAPDGTLTVRTGTDTGALGTGASAAGWPVTSTVVPFGDLSGDRCNDLLVRDAAGFLTRYDGGCGKAFAPSGARLVIGGGWNAYDSLTAPGDLTGDGRTDLLARTPAGELYLYADDGAGKFAPRVRIGVSWQVYNTVVGVGDLNGDKAGDLIARDTAGVLWRYYGTGKGTLSARVQIGVSWQVYDTLAGVGDFTGDGKADLVARDAAGVLWRYEGTGTGAFAGRVRMGDGWQVYKTLS